MVGRGPSGGRRSRWPGPRGGLLRQAGVRTVPGFCEEVHPYMRVK